MTGHDVVADCRSATVVLLDDAPIRRRILRQALQGRIDLIGEVSNVTAAIDISTERAPDVMLLGLSLPDSDRDFLIEALRLSSPHTRVVVLPQDWAKTTSTSTASGLDRRFGEHLAELIRPPAEPTAWIEPALGLRSLQPVRLFIDHHLSAWRLGDLREPAYLIVSELAAEPVTRGHSPWNLTLRLLPTTLRIEIRDFSHRHPDTAGSVRSDAGRLTYTPMFAASWDQEPVGHRGRLVWAEMDRFRTW